MAIQKRRGIIYIDFSCYLPDGRKVRCVESTGMPANKRNLEIARAKEQAIKYELRHGRFNYLHFFPNGSKVHLFQRTASDTTIRELFKLWISEKSVRKGTLRNYNDWYAIIEPYFGDRIARSITLHEILVVRRSLQEKGLRDSTINAGPMNLLRMLYKRAEKMNIPNPMEGVKRLTEYETDIDPYNFEELQELLEAARGSFLYDLIILWSRTGLRAGEICGLKWEDIDWHYSQALVKRTASSHGVGPPKTRHSKRKVDLRPAVVDALRRQETRTGLARGYIFLTQNGNHWTPHMLRDKWIVLHRKAGLRYRPSNQMRHTFATLHIAAGENITWVSKMLGHSNVTITLQRYNRYVPNLTREDGSAFEKVMNGKDEGITKATHYEER